LTLGKKKRYNKITHSDHGHSFPPAPGAKPSGAFFV